VSTHVNMDARRSASTIRARADVGRQIAKLIAAAIIASVAALGAGDVVQAGRIGPGGDWRSGGGLSCGTGSLSAPLPVVIADAAGFAWQFSDLYGHDGTTWVFLARSQWRYTTLGPGESNQGKWLDQITGRLQPFDSFSVTPGSYYLITQYVYVDGAWGSLQPLHPGYAGFGPLPFCFA
jgi:hypothetical protein